MNRKTQRKRLLNQSKFDIVIIGGGATGLGVALDAASRGYKVALLEAYDFAKGTSSRSTKLVHGGVRYLAQGDIPLVYEALHERGLMAKNAAHLVSKQSFVIPNYNTVDGYYYTTGLKVYNWMSRSLSLGKTKFLNEQESLKKLPTLKPEGLKNGVSYFDGQFDDARLAINIAQTAVENNAVVVNYMKVVEIIKNNEGRINGVVAKDVFTDEEFTINTKVLVNATGIFVDQIKTLDTKKEDKSILPSQGVHLVVDKKFLKSKHALMVPKTSDGRVLFAVPWHDKVIIGTTDTPMDSPQIEPKALEEEINFIITTFNQYINKSINRKDVLSVFAGLRPLPLPKDNKKGSKEISREHKIEISDTGLVTISGGKWTTYRKIAEDTVDKIIRAHKLKDAECVTQNLAIHGNVSKSSLNKKHPLYWYGSDLHAIEAIEDTDAKLKEKIHPNYPYTMAQVAWAVENEFVETPEDFLARRIRLLFLDAKASIESVEKVTQLIANLKNKDATWITNQIKNYTTLAQRYLISS